MATRSIPFTKPFWDTKEVRAVSASLAKTIGTGDGPNTKVLVELLSQHLNIPYVLPVTSCTHGLELILQNMGLHPGDEVIVPSYTMSSTANAIVLAGATPVFADIEPLRYTIDPVDIQRCITPHTKGIIIVHYAGMPCYMEEIMGIAKKHNLFVVEDAAHTIGASYKNKSLGTFGDAGSYSFHGTKNICCGEGGAVVTRSKKFADAMEIFRANGTNRREFLRGTVDKYTWVGPGTSFFLSDILSAILVEQVKKIPVITKRRQNIARAYTNAFEPFMNKVRLPIVPKHASPNWHIYAMQFETETQATKFLDGMRDKGIGVSTHYVPLHTAPMGLSLAKKNVRSLPVTDHVARTLVRLPIYAGMTKKDVSYIIAKATALLKQM
jgi:dTDP-4-amino-4,6-dideoxygalactose transaminase